MSHDLFCSLDLLLDSRPDAQKSGLSRMVVIAPNVLISAATALLDTNYHLEDISALDVREGYLVTYHFDHFARPAGSGRILRIALRVLTPHDEAHLPSIAAVFSGAEWHEREISDFFGIHFNGNPNPAALLLPEEDDTTPLRKAPDKRCSLKDLIDPGHIVFAAAGFALFKDDSQAAVQPSPSTTNEHS